MQVARAGANQSAEPGGAPPNRLRRIRMVIAAAVVVGAGVLAATYFLQPRPAELKVRQVSLEVQQTAHGFVLSRSEGGRMLFRLRARVATEMQRRHHTILQQVDLVVFDRDGVHADRISGERFQYDPDSGDVIAAGEVHIALEGRKPLARGAGGKGQRRGSPIEAVAQQLTFNTKTGTALASGGLDFRYGNAAGHADEARLTAGASRMVLSGDVRLRWAPPGRWPLEIRAGEAVLDKAARTITLTGGAPAGGTPAPRGETAAGATPAARVAEPVVRLGPRRLVARKLIFQLGIDDAVRSAEAVGEVHAEAGQAGRVVTVDCQTARLDLQPPAAREAGPSRRAARARGPLRQPDVRLKLLTLSGGVMVRSRQTDGARQRLQAATAEITFGAKNAPAGGEATQATVWVAGLGQGRNAGAAREGELTAPVLRFAFGPGGQPGQTVLRRAWTEGRGRLRYEPGRRQGTVRIAANQFTLALNSAERPETAQAIGEIAWSQAGTSQEAARQGTAGKAQVWMDPQTGGMTRLVAGGGLRLEAAGTPAVQASGQGGTAEAAASGAQGTDGFPRLNLAPAGATVAAESLVWEAASGVARLLPEAGGTVAVTTASGRLTAPELILTPVSVVATGGVTATTVANGNASGEGILGPGAGGLRREDGPVQEDGNLPVNITSSELAVSRNGNRGIFAGDVRVWRGSSMLRAAALAFDRARGTVTASGAGAAGVRSSFVAARGGRLAAGQTRLEAAGNATGRPPLPRAGGRPAARPPEPVAVQVRAPVFHYWRRRGLAEFSGGVVARAAATRLSCQYLRIEWTGGKRRPARLVAGGGVQVRQPGRRAAGETAIYDVARRMVTLRGGSPSIYDAELGLLAGSALTFSPVNATIRVESGAGTRTFAAYRVRH